METPIEIVNMPSLLKVGNKMFYDGNFFKNYYMRNRLSCRRSRKTVYKEIYISLIHLTFLKTEPRIWKRRV